MPHTKSECFERTRLNFIVYVVDHHSSLSHGRPPMTRELPSLKGPRALLRSKFSTSKDLNLISEMELWSISSQVFDVFGADIESSFDQLKSAELQRLTKTFDEWYREWMEILTLRDMLDQSTQHMFSLYSSSARLYLFSHVFRGPAQRNLTLPFDNDSMNTVATHAVEEAMSIIRCISAGTREESRLRPENLPSYFSTVSAFACVLLLRASEQEQSLQKVDKGDVLRSLHGFITSIQSSSPISKPVYSIPSIVDSLKSVIDGRDWGNGESVVSNGGDYRVDSFPLSFDLFGNDLFGMSFIDDHTNCLSFPGLTETETSEFTESQRQNYLRD
jgi:hypothetical protein